MTGVSKQAIRYYDKIGLLKPGKTDADNAYRYYEPIQVLYLNTIMRLSQLGCSLKETARYLYGRDLDDVKSMLEGRRTLTEQKISELQSALHTLNHQIHMIEEGMRARCIEGVQTKEMGERHFVFVARHAPTDIKNGIMQINTLVRDLNRQGLLFVGSPVFELTQEEGLLKTGFFCNERVKAKGFEVDVVPAGTYAYMYHKGVYDQIPGVVKKIACISENAQAESRIRHLSDVPDRLRADAK